MNFSTSFNNHFFKEKTIKGVTERKMIEKCNFKSKIRHHEFHGCDLTPEDIVCPGEEKCILYQIYYNTKKNLKINNFR